MFAILSFILSYYFVAVLQTILHKLFGHKDRIHNVFKKHALGHHAKYTPSKLLSEKYIDSELHVMWYFLIPIIPVLAALICFTSVTTVVSFSVGLIFSIWWHFYIHEQYHIKNSVLERFDWFIKKRKLHLIHHLNPNSNFAVTEFWIDKIMNTKTTVLGE